LRISRKGRNAPEKYAILDKIFCGFMCKGQNNQRQPDFHRKTAEKAGKELLKS